MPIGKVKLKASPPTTIRIIIAKQTRGTGIIPAFIVEPRLGLHRLCPPMPPAVAHDRVSKSPPTSVTKVFMFILLFSELAILIRAAREHSGEPRNTEPG